MDKQYMKAGVAMVAVAALGACASNPLNRGEPALVADAGVSVNCPATGPEPWIREFTSLEQVLAWQTDNGMELLTPGAEPGRYAIVGMGQRNTGGYGIAVAREARLDDGTLRLKATFVAPGGGGMTTQMLSSPCALVRMPRDTGWQLIEVYDQTGRLRATLRSAP